MIKFGKGLLASALGVALFAGAGAAQAITLNTTTAANALVAGNAGEGAPGATGGDGILQNFTGFDYNSNGQVLITGFVVPPGGGTGTTFPIMLYFQGFADAIFSSSLAPDLRVAQPGAQIGTYEITAVSSIGELATCLTANCSVISLTLNPAVTSTFSVYFDRAPNANPVAGTGYTDGVVIASGVYTSEPISIFAATAPIGTPGATGSGSAQLNGAVTFTNLAYISPALVGTQVNSDLRFPGEPTFTRSAMVNGVSTGATDTSTQFVLAADARQSFTAAVPEPETVALLGLGLLAIGVSRRRAAK